MTREEAAELLLAMSGNSIWEDELEAYNMAIEALQERPKGRWIRHPHNPWTYECSCCERKISMVMSHEKVNELYPYCHCGADMREGESND